MAILVSRTSGSHAIGLYLVPLHFHTYACEESFILSFLRHTLFTLI